MKHELNAQVEESIRSALIWKDELQALRTILLNSGLKEEWKWNAPCYSAHGKNIAVMQAFKKYFALLFFKGHLLTDPQNILIKTGPNTKVGRQIRFSNTKEILKMEAILQAYLIEAVEVEKARMK